MKHALLGLALFVAMPVLAQTAPDLNDLDPNTLPPAPAQGNALDLMMPQLYTASEPDRVVNGCIVPGRPDWLIEMNPATTNERAMVHAIYNLRWSKAVVENEDCDCALRHPDWAEVIAEFNESYAGMDKQQMFDTQMSYRSMHHQRVARARAICREQSR
ncbi:hypothetical protein [Roseinatronobacter sp. S2]|uniref:hypothetical protein n=1 Tax=Roseinatronobacter sp. S2 TaxID=3035471 RepID=UPI0024109CCE|nr:hypothetical protein [Roseinatronobacter sp. S2]WFE77205.1 hypothetical protein P8S53_20325 [Roseinatronobacter sp. S2]